MSEGKKLICLQTYYREVQIFKNTLNLAIGAQIAGRQLLPLFSYRGFDPRFQTGGFKTGHSNHVKSALFLYPILK